MLPKIKAFAINALRRAHVRWLPANAAWNAARVENPIFSVVIPKDRSRIGYKCNHCREIFRKKECNLDHILPVAGVEGFTTLDNYATRLYVEEEAYQVLCIPCHRIKSNGETTERAEERRK